VFASILPGVKTMTNNASSYNEFILKSAEQYLQTVVLIDDRIYESKSGSVAVPLTKPPTGGRKPALKSASARPKHMGISAGLDKTAEKAEEVSFHEVQNSFAKKRIICSLYQPRKDASFSERSEVYKLCSTADVVVVDWDIYGDGGNKATELVGNLIQQSMKDVPQQLRLVFVYTLDVNLGAVANKIYENLNGRLGKEAISVEDESEGLVLATNNVRLVVLGKRANGSLSQYSAYFVPERNLAERTIIEFSRLASGLLQSIVLRGIAHLRENNRRILMRFHDGLDLAFLTHRALLLPDQDAFGQIVTLLTDELRAVLEDKLGNSPIGTEPTVERIIADWCKTNWTPGSEVQSDIGNEGDAKKFATDVFCKGRNVKILYSTQQSGKIASLLNSIKEKGGNLQWGKISKRLELTEYLLGDRHGDSCYQQLSSLMSQRVRYGNVPRTLRLGVILKEMADEERYLLCLQPVCDSVRIAGTTRNFVFCVLAVAKDGQRTTHNIMDINNKAIHLEYKPKVSNCFVAAFTSGTDDVRALSDNGQFVFEDKTKKRYEWIAELKTEHAQRAAEEFGRTLSRVGLTESEWLRLKAR
jgi:hypothetical protein